MSHEKTARQQVLDAAQYPGSGLSLVSGPLAMDQADELDRLREINAELVKAVARIVNGGNVDCGTYWKVDAADINEARDALAKASA